MGQAKRKEQDPGLKCIKKLGFTKSYTRLELERKAKKYLGVEEATRFIELLKKDDASYLNKIYSSPEYALFFADGWDTEIIRNEINYVDAHKDKLGNTITDIGCGNGLVDCMLGWLYPEKSIVGYDTDEQAVLMAKEMAKRYNVSNVTFLVSDDKTEYKTCDTLLLFRLNIFLSIRNELNSKPEFSYMPMRFPYDIARKFCENSIKQYSHFTECLRTGGLILAAERNHYILNDDFELVENAYLPRAVDGLSLAMVLNYNGISFFHDSSYEKEIIDGGVINMPFYFLSGVKDEKKVQEEDILKNYLASISIDPEMLMDRAEEIEIEGFKARYLSGSDTAWIIDYYRDQFIDGYSLGDIHGISVKKEVWKCKDQYMIYQDGYCSKKALLFFPESYAETDVLTIFKTMKDHDPGIKRGIVYSDNLEVFEL